MKSLTDEGQIAAWRSYMKDYTDTKRGKDAGNTDVWHRSNEKKTKEYDFDTVLAQYRDPRKEAAEKERDLMPIDFKRKAVKEHLDSKDQGFDIITLEKHKDDLAPYTDRLKKKRILPKAQVVYNILTNNEHPEHHWRGAQRPEPKKEYSKKVNMDIFRDYNIISNEYWEGHDTKDEVDRNNSKQELVDKYKKTHDFDYVTCKFYDEAKQDDYLRERDKLQKEHGKDYLNRLPPTLKARETIVFDSTKEVPEEVKRFDIRKRNQKKRYEKRAELEQEYRDKDIEMQDKAEQLALNRYDGGKYYEEKQKGYDNITLNPTREQIKNLKGYAHAKPHLSLWEQIQAEAEERVPDMPGSYMNEAPVCQVNKVVDIDNIPIYRRSVEAAETQSRQDQPHAKPENASQKQYSADQSPQYNSPEPDLQINESKPVFESMQQKSVSGDRQKLYDSGLHRDANLYRQSDADNQSNHKPASVANSGSHKYSRMNSGMSNKSKLSFASEGMRSRQSQSSNKLPAISRPEISNPYNPQASVKSGGSKRSVASSAKKSNLIESGAFY